MLENQQMSNKLELADTCFQQNGTTTHIASVTMNF